MTFTAWKMKKETDTKTDINVFIKTSGSCVIALMNNSLIEQNSLEPTL